MEFLPSFLLQVDGYTEIEVAALGKEAGVNSLIEHTVACGELRIVACVL